MQEHTAERRGGCGKNPVQAIDDMLAEIEAAIRQLQLQLAAHDGARQALRQLLERLKDAGQDGE